MAPSRFEDVRNPILLPTLKAADRAIEFVELFAQKRQHVDRPHAPSMANAPSVLRSGKPLVVVEAAERFSERNETVYIRSAFMIPAASIGTAPRANVIAPFEIIEHGCNLGSQPQIEVMAVWMQQKIPNILSKLILHPFPIRDIREIGEAFPHQLLQHSCIFA
jgi:hypothetical protein